MRSLADQMEKLGPLKRTQEDNIAAGTTLTALCSALRLYGQTETAGRAVTAKDGVTVDMSLRRSVSAPQMFNCGL